MFVTPALRVKFAPGFPVSPWASIGGGWAHYNLTGISTNKGALQFGGGVDINTGIPLLGFRAEVRDFVTDQPAFQNGESHRPWAHQALDGGTTCWLVVGSYFGSKEAISKSLVSFRHDLWLPEWLPRSSTFLVRKTMNLHLTLQSQLKFFAS